MKTFTLFATIIALGLAPALAQHGPGAAAQGPNFGGATGKLFGDHQSFTAKMEFGTGTGENSGIVMVGKINFDSGKSRFELNMSDTRGTLMPQSAVQQLKSMGMDAMVMIGRPDLKLSYIVYPGLNSYAEVAMQDATGSTNATDFKVETTELGKETLDGHDCIKNKVTVTDKDNNKTEFTVWNATDLKNFPIKIVTTGDTGTVTMAYKDVTFTKSGASLFDPPSAYTKYTDVQTMMMTEMKKKMTGMGGMGMPPEQN